MTTNITSHSVVGSSRVINVFGILFGVSISVLALARRLRFDDDLDYAVDPEIQGFADNDQTYRAPAI
jgi:hypothetical protein